MSLKLISSDKLYTEIKRLEEQMTKTNSDMFEYYSLLEIERLWKLAGWLDKRTQRREMHEWNL